MRILGEAGTRPATGRLLTFLRDPADEVRLEAMVAVEAFTQAGLAEEFRPAVQASMHALLADPVERVRQGALTVLGRGGVFSAGSQEVYASLMAALGDPSAAIRAQASDALAAAGKAAIAIVHPLLNSPDARMRKMAAVILGRVDPRQFGALVESHITSDLLSIYRSYGLAEALAACEGVPSLALLRSALHEQSRDLRDGIFYLLAAVHEPSAVAVIEESFHSEAERTRSNAAEALESMTSPRVAGLVAPLFEPDLPPAHLLAIGKDTWNITFDGPAQVIQDLLTRHEDAWLRSLAAYSLGEWGTAAGTSDAADCLPDDPEVLLQTASADPAVEVRQAALLARRKLAGAAVLDADHGEGFMLSVIEKIILMKEVPFFQGMTVEQLKVLASVCEEQFFPAGAADFWPGRSRWDAVRGREWSGGNRLPEACGFLGPAGDPGRAYLLWRG